MTLHLGDVFIAVVALYLYGALHARVNALQTVDNRFHPGGGDKIGSEVRERDKIEPSSHMGVIFMFKVRN